MGKRTWFKIYADGWLEGSIRKETPLTRSIFIDLMALAASGKYGDEGKIALAVDVGMTFFQLTNLLQVSKNQLQTALHNLKKSQRIEVRANGIITILNWQKYQSEYSRQSNYRLNTPQKVVTFDSNQKLQGEVTDKVTPEKEKEKEKENTTIAHKVTNTETVFSVIANIAFKAFSRSLTQKEIAALEKDANDLGEALIEQGIKLSIQEKDVSKHNLNYALGIARRLKETVLNVQASVPGGICDDGYYKDLN